MKILVFGAGAVGLGLSTFFIEHHVDVAIITRETACEEIKKQGLKRSGIFGDCFIEPVRCKIYSHLHQLPSDNPSFDYVLVCTKSTDTLAAAELLQSCAAIHDKKTIFVLFQNGWGNAEIFAEFFPENNIFNARVITGFYRTATNHVTITVHADDIHIGSLLKGDLLRVKPLAEKLNESGFPCCITTEIEKDLWAKMFYNCALNPLGALFRVPYGALAQESYTRDIMDKIIHEAFSVMVASGYKTHWQSAQDYLRVFYDTLIPATAEHESSMLQDIQRQKQTEIEGLNGAVLTLGKKNNIPLPYNHTIYNMIKFIEHTYQ